MPVTHTIQAGESLANIAFDHGLLPDMIWGHPDNQALRAERPDMNMLMAGDSLVLPDKRLREHAAETDKRHRFRLKGVPHVFQLQLLDDDEPRGNEAYKLTVQGKFAKAELSGSTDIDGVLKAHIPPGAKSARLVMESNAYFDRLELDILLGSLDPVDELSGVQKRLANLGFNCGADAPSSAAMSEAIAAFQRQFELPVTGEADAATRAKLGEVHDQTTVFNADPDEPR